MAQATCTCAKERRRKILRRVWYSNGCRSLDLAENVPGISHILDLKNWECTSKLIGCKVITIIILVQSKVTLGLDALLLFLYFPSLTSFLILCFISLIFFINFSSTVFMNFLLIFGRSQYATRSTYGSNWQQGMRNKEYLTPICFGPPFNFGTTVDEN